MKLTVYTQKETAETGDLYGLFFEDISQAADGGLYAELVQNRSFEFSPVDNPHYHGLTAWEKVEDGGSVELTIREGGTVSGKNPHYLEMDLAGPGEAGVQNLGFNSGIPLRKGGKYEFSCYARGRDITEIEVSLRGADGAVYQAKRLPLTGRWEKCEAVLAAPAEDWTGRLVITAAGRGRIDLDLVSLFPQDTYKGHRNGLRRDLAEALAAMRPKFLRFPGGCLVHDGALDPDARNSQYRWKNSIGPIEHRPARRNNWGYNQTLGLGFYEYFIFCEDIGAKPLPVLPGGYNPHNGEAAEGEALDAFVQDALDLIEFANGDTDTEWGAKRAEMGHPEPFGLEYLAIGNEEVGQAFYDRYPLFYRAIKARYPEIRVIGTSGPFCAGPEYERGWRSAREDGADLVDEHYYQSPEWFVAHHHRYDGFPEGPKVFLGEYAAKGNAWRNALAEASFMTGLERNARSVGLACYAPLLCNGDYCNWRPNMIWFDNHRVMRTPNYYVQKLFMEHQGSVLLEQEITGADAAVKWLDAPDDLTGGFALSGYESTVEYTNISITNLDTGEKQNIPASILCQGNEERSVASISWPNYSLSLKARELDGWKGFQLWFARRDRNSMCLWQLGGWNNGDSQLVEIVNGQNSTLTQRERHVEKGRVYHLELQVRGRRLTAFVDGEKELETEALPPLAEPLYAVSGRDRAGGDVIVKLVNILPDACPVTVCLEGMDAAEGTAFWMSGYGLEAENVLGEPEQVVPREERVSFSTGHFDWLMQPESLCILRLHKPV